ncbi:transmembrane protein 154 [Spea bombifrons]|uniref:transmembrane protein 154 n=1 Tax=Spea bombifrons TaxID=233779 RepID=UPI00234A982C|nr:transmembrane protein 154 [Spea bombifrons]
MDIGKNMLKYLGATASLALLPAASGGLTSTESDVFSGNYHTTQSIGWTEEGIPELSAISANTESGNETPVTFTPSGFEDSKGFDMTTSNNGIFLSNNGVSITSIVLFALPVLILVLLVPLIYVIIKHKKWKKDNKDMTRDENVKSPIFEEDTPSVMEIEMEELDKWMDNMRKNGNRLSVLVEEKVQMDQSDIES